MLGTWRLTTVGTEAKRMTRVKHVGDRIEEILGFLRTGDSRYAASAEELTGLLVGLYGDGLSRIVATLAEAGPPGTGLLARLTEDPLVESLLLLHDLHPLDVDARVQRALDQVRPYLGSHAGGVEYLGVDGTVARLRLEGSCHGCPSSTVTVRLAIEDAVKNAAPEITEVSVEGMTEPPAPSPALLQIGRRPDDGDPGGTGANGAGPAPPGLADGDGAWVTLPSLGPPSARPVSALAGGVPVLVCAVRGTLYAYRDACPACGESMAAGQLDREVLTCPCGERYDVRAAGRGLAGEAGHTGLHLNPLPLLTDSAGVRVAVPAAAGTVAP
jgi:Fe-S cluster biogenesis protein NfuA/nitrite reductase/ring-hydroxylating ferredoxin subunit